MTTPAAIISTGRMFPVHQAGAVEWRRRIAAGEKLPPWPRAVPWAMVEAQAAQVACNHQQSVEQLARRGGLTPPELAAVLTGQSFSRHIAMADALLTLHRLVDAWIEASDG